MSAAAPGLPGPIATWAGRPRGDRLARLARTPVELTTVVGTCSTSSLTTPSPIERWAAVHVIGHLRDMEEFSLVRFRMMLRMDDPSVPAAGMPADPVAWGLIEDGAWLFDPERWAEDRQYARDDPPASAATFARNRARTLASLDALAEADWDRGSIHPLYGRLTFDDWTAVLAWHDDNHLAQLGRIVAATDR
jgi:hypothetical protein